ncbi:MAG TPA: RagB/SusD family nutrient uptake outer membrane protein [Longimicrobiales bacterium]
MNSRTRNALAVVAALTLFGAAGCTDTTVEPQSTITQTNVFNDVNTYKGFVARVYAGLAVSGQQGPAGRPDIQGIDEGFSQYLRLYWEAQELPTDAAVIGWGDVGLPEMNTQMWAASNSFVVAMYYRIFFQVAMANEFLRETSPDKMASRNVSTEVNNAVQTYRAEARFLRALSYWHGIDLFGDIPFVTEEDELGATPPQQSTREEIFDFIVTELNAIRTQLPAGAGTYGRATPAAASMLLAKLYLNSEVYTGTPRYADALTAAQQAIAAGYTLDTNWRRMFMADNHNSPEIIFPVTQDGVHTQTWGGMTFLIHASVGGSMSASAYGIDGAWWGLRLKPQTYGLFAAGDQRASFFYTNGQTVGIAEIPNFNHGVAAPKYSNRTSTGAPGSHATHVDTDFPMFRLADAYLMYAEAHLRGGGGTRAQALAYVNALRQRAYGGTAGNIADAELTLPFIIAERGRELMWEGHRRTDLIRFGLFTGGDYLWAWKGGVQAGRSTESFRDLYPLPANELVANPNLTQNPGY